MKTTVRNLMAVMAVAAFAACSSNDVFNAEVIEDNQKASYAENFVKKYPNVDLSQQTWDYSTKQESYSLPESNNKARTRASEGRWFKEDDWYEIDPNTVSWLQANLTEGEDHRDLGSPFYMTVPGTDFNIVTVYQGGASAVWEFHVVIGNEDYLIWGKSEDLEIKDLTNDNWHKCWEVKTYEWGGDGTKWEALFNTDGTDRWTWIPDQGGQRNKVTAIRSIPRHFTGFPVGEDMYFYLKVTRGDEGYTTEGAEESSLNGQMLALMNAPRPAGIPENYEYMFVSCEDAHLEKSDWDMNDVVFLVYGENIPKPIEIKEGDPVLSKKTVRYMIEDLGATDDFDFNDIVLDVADVTVKTPIYTNKVLTEWKVKETYQEAVIRHLGGVLPFKLTIGDTQLEEHVGVLGANPDEVYRVSGWDINRHNVSVQVRQNSSSDVYNSIQFPKAGEVPMVIAVDPSQGWMNERNSVPESWFYIPENK